MASSDQPRTPLIQLLIEANKRADGTLAGVRMMGAKLFGAQPENTCAAMPEISVHGLTHHLLGTISELEDELQRQHQAMGDINQQPQVAGQARASGY